eukprot:CAMPEP_0170069512 /NCGR_PEP_ID=MMETSP0019_2-20121128/8160_1 /TAXON_ID=98059 /ORGANISM="Dinobryon sp., Strain UTEXLB2267" /LENGTH=346 /DNA_ID=CAMNT_0010277577 /DNA_START=494 /DNA_END=1531 /DNA_ORIENTATION=-
MCMVGVQLNRVATASLDRTVVLYDISADTVCARISLPQSLEAIACSPLQDLLCVGSSQGSIFLVSLGLASIATHSQLHLGLLSAASTSASAGRLPRGLGGPEKHSLVHPLALEGHTKAVTALSVSSDNTHLVSASLDGSLRVWHLWTRQCVRDCRPLHRSPLSCMMLVRMPEEAGSAVVKPVQCVVAALRKFSEPLPPSEVVLGPCMLGRHTAGLEDGDGDGRREEVLLSEQKQRKRKGLPEQDFIFLAKEDDEEVPVGPVAISREEESNMALELQETRQQLQRMQEENLRWQRVCMKMKEHLDDALLQEEEGRRGRKKEKEGEEREKEEDTRNQLTSIGPISSKA